ncbi:MAG: RagB/SusD family nutrient uptake outer membrane protein [Muribaculaceae bacterium]|nr:RagB/SusD family nutrient uptake outer membrane protein [Muribaculaceae bacterium]
MKIFKSNIFSLGFAAAALVSIATGCAESFLDVSSKVESNTENFYKTEGDAWRALIGCYDGWRQISSCPGVGFMLASDVLSDECYGGTGSTDGYGYQAMDQFDLSLSPADQNLYEQDWKVYYGAVYRCNELCDHEEQINWIGESGKRGLYMGECRAIRAILYFDMVRMWGNIPLFLEAVDENREQADPAEVYKAIVDDMKYAIANIPADANLANSDNGRITKYAMEAMLARVYLYYTGYYGKDLENLTKQEVLDGLEDIVKNGNYALVSEFKNLWPAASLVPLGEDSWDPELSTFAGQANSEFMLQQKFTPSQDYDGNNDSNRWQVMFGMRNLTFAPYLNGWGAATVCPSFVNKYSPDDPRLTASIINTASEGIAESSSYSDAVAGWREFTGYCVKKYSPIAYANGLNASKEEGTANFQEQNTQDYVLMRYADVLLMIAELGGVPSKSAQDALDEVRNRAGMASVPATFENIMNERAIELAFEGIRYWDLLRQGVDVLADAVCASAGPVKNGGVDATVNYKRENIIAKKGLFQIPNNQITLSNYKLKQNPGWEN